MRKRHVGIFADFEFYDAFAAGELLGKSIWDEFPGLIGSPFEKIYRAAMDDRITGTITDYFPDHARWYEVTVYPAADGVTVYFRDLTERKLSEAALRKSGSGAWIPPTERPFWCLACRIRMMLA